MIDRETYQSYNNQHKFNQNRPHPSDIKFDFSKDNEYDSLHANDILKSKNNNNNELRGTTKKIIQVSNNEDETTLRSNQLLLSSRKPFEEKPSIQVTNPNEFRNRLKQEIEKLHHQQEVEKFDNKNEENIVPINEEPVKQESKHLLFILIAKI
jgi:hypothetical protein